jgi:hypothetical protein
MLRIAKFDRDGTASFNLSSRIDGCRVPELRALLDGEPQVSGLVLDLQEVKLVDREAVKFLATCESRGIRLMNCPSYVREWIEQGGCKA